jgi:hypothetical protein
MFSSSRGFWFLISSFLLLMFSCLAALYVLWSLIYGVLIFHRPPVKRLSMMTPTILQLHQIPQ